MAGTPTGAIYGVFPQQIQHPATLRRRGEGGSIILAPLLLLTGGTQASKGMEIMKRTWKMGRRADTYRRNSSGFTLLEVVIAICLLSFALLALAQLQIVAVRDNAFANGMTAAATLAQDKLEELMGQPYASILAGQDNAGQYTRQWNVDNDIPTPGMKSVTVTVSRQNGPTVQMRTVICQP